jgi:hypothetical protein
MTNREVANNLARYVGNWQKEEFKQEIEAVLSAKDQASKIPEPSEPPKDYDSHCAKVYLAEASSWSNIRVQRVEDFKAGFRKGLEYQRWQKDRLENK